MSEEHSKLDGAVRSPDTKTFLPDGMRVRSLFFNHEHVSGKDARMGLPFAQALAGDQKQDDQGPQKPIHAIPAGKTREEGRWH